eukprot:scaffold43636_cov199-Amphora_coffeaeformis.AAC.1
MAMNNVMLAQLMKDMQDSHTTAFIIVFSPAADACCNQFSLSLCFALPVCVGTTTIPYDVTTTTITPIPYINPYINPYIFNINLFNTTITQDPEMMREAQKMMQDPAFQAYMKQMMAAPQFQQAIQKTKQDMQDPEKLKEMEEKAKQAIQEGSK